MKYLALALLPCIATAGAASQEIEWVEDDFCEKAAEIGGYEIELGGLDLSFPRDLQIVIDGRTVLENGRSEGWHDNFKGKWVAPYNGLQVAVTNDHVLVVVFFNDCVDIWDSHLFMFTKQGEFILSQHIWTSFWEETFYYEGKNLVFWSGWHCNDNNEMYSAEASYVYVQSGNNSFKKDVRPSNLLCTPEAISEINQRKIEFTYLDPEIHRSGLRQREPEKE